MSYSLGLLMYHARRAVALLLFSRSLATSLLPGTSTYTVTWCVVSTMRWGEAEWAPRDIHSSQMAVSTKLWVWTQYEATVHVLTARRSP